jgi:hypothetical protein
MGSDPTSPSSAIKSWYGCSSDNASPPPPPFPPATATGVGGAIPLRRLPPTLLPAALLLEPELDDLLFPLPDLEADPLAVERELARDTTPLLAWLVATELLRSNSCPRRRREDEDVVVEEAC